MTRMILTVFSSLLFISGCLFDHDSGVLVLPPSDSPWHLDIEATWFDILAASPSPRTAFNDVDAHLENPFYVALPFNSSVYSGTDPSLKTQVKNRWVHLVNAVNSSSCYAQWEDVGPWFVDDFEYVFSSDGSRRPAAESFYGADKGIYLHKEDSNTRKVANKAGIDLSPKTAEFMGISGKGKVHWRLVSVENVPSGPWLEKVSTTPPHYSKNAPPAWTSNR
ncbi:MAG: hypothetical protein PHQ23_17430 [Candidatus Wallbacteria bacterium]|nr:hypothetical protein [Candidatus Wallbacteria bacterium]